MKWTPPELFFYSQFRFPFLFFVLHSNVWWWSVICVLAVVNDRTRKRVLCQLNGNNFLYWNSKLLPPIFVVSDSDFTERWVCERVCVCVSVVCLADEAAAAAPVTLSTRLWQLNERKTTVSLCCCWSGLYYDWSRCWQSSDFCINSKLFFIVDRKRFQTNSNE